MSKLIDNLNHVQTAITEKPAKPITKSPIFQSPIQDDDPKDSGRPQLNRRALYPIFGTVAVIVVLSLTLSYRALALIRERSFELSKLSGIITKQNDKIKSLEDSIGQLSSQQSQQLAEVKDGMRAIEKIISTNTQELAQMAMDHDVLRASIKDLKAENKTSKENYSFLTGEIGRVKQNLAKMMGETASAQQK